MPRKPRLKSRSGIYHVIYRGANRQEIFHDEDDNMQFLATILRYKQSSNLKVFAWCMMNNHVHLLLKEGNEDLSLTLKRISVSFAYYYNAKYRTSGHLFQDRFRSENVESREYFFTVIRYIHQNPVKAGIVQRVDEWNWSSCQGYDGKNIYPVGLLDYDFALELVSNDILTARERFKEFNQRKNSDICLEDEHKVRMTDEDARLAIRGVLGAIEIPQVKSMTKVERDSLLRKVKELDGLSQRQAARILGVSASLINRT